MSGDITSDCNEVDEVLLTNADVDGASVGTGSLESVTDAAAKSSSLKIPLSKGTIPIFLNPEHMLARVKAF